MWNKQASHSVLLPKPKPQAKSRKPQRGVAAVALGFLVTAGLAGLYRVEDVRPSVLQCMSVIKPLFTPIQAFGLRTYKHCIAKRHSVTCVAAGAVLGTLCRASALNADRCCAYCHIGLGLEFYSSHRHCSSLMGTESTLFQRLKRKGCNQR